MSIKKFPLAYEHMPTHSRTSEKVRLIATLKCNNSHLENFVMYIEYPLLNP